MSWVLVFLVTIHILRGADDKVFHQAGMMFGCARLLTMISLIFFVLAVVLARLTRFDSLYPAPAPGSTMPAPGAPGWMAADTDRLVDGLGMFYHCQQTGEASKCRFIHYNCMAVPDHYTLLPEPLFNTALTDCHEFNGIRTCGVIALILAGFAVIAQHHYRWSGTDRAKAVAIGSGYFSAFWGMASFSLALDYFHKNTTSELGSAFWFLMLAWVVIAVSTFIFARSKRPESCDSCNHCDNCGKDCKDGSCDKKAENKV